MKVLVAEDDRVTRLRISALLRQWGHEVVAAEDGREAWKQFRKEGPQLILTDWQMPGMDGIELVRRIREHSEVGGRYAYILMLTSRSDTADLVAGIEAGADDFISKPFANAELKARIRAGVRIIELEQTLGAKNRSLMAANAEISAANRRMRRELEAAATVQHAFLPTGFPHTDRARFAWSFEPCEELSGDALNILPFDENRVGLYMVDVCGHGVAAALRSVHVSRLFSLADQPDSIVRHDHGNRENGLESPAAVAAHLNESFPAGSPGGALEYFTLLYGILDLEKKRFEYTSAGHPGPIIVPADEKREAMIFEADPPAVGFFKDAHFTQQSVSLESGDRIYLYTDGVFEVRNEQGEEFGELRLADQLAGLRDEPLELSIRQISQSAREWSHRELFDDDISLLGVEVA